MTEKLFADASLVFFDTTSTYFEGAGPEELASFGLSRDKRGDRPRAHLALLTSREGLPLGHWLYPGKQSDVKTMAEASREFRDRPGLGSFVVVANRGMVPAANLETLRSEGIESVIAGRLRRNTAHAALARAGRYKRVNRNLEVKEIKTDGTESVLVCRNRERARGRAAARRHRAAAPRADRAGRRAGPTQDRRQAVPRARGRHPRDRPQEGSGGRPLRRQVGAAHHNQLAAGAGGAGVPRSVACRERLPHPQDPLELRPLFHSSEAGVRGHVQACVLAYTLVRVIEDRLDAAGLDMNAREALQDLARIQRAPLYRAGITVTKASVPTEQPQRLLAASGAPLPERHTAT